MKKNGKKFVSLIVAAFMVFGMIVAPVQALAKNVPSITKQSIGILQVTNVNDCRLVGLTPTGKKKASIGVKSTYKLKAKWNGGNTVDWPKEVQQRSFTTTRICANAFKGSKATSVSLPATIKRIDAKAFNGTKVKTIRIASKSLTKAYVKGMLKGVKTSGNVTILLPKAKKAAYSKIFTAWNLGHAVTLKWV